MALVEIDTLFDGVEAQIMRGRLQAAGIDAVLFDGAIASLIGPGLWPCSSNRACRLACAS